MPSGFLTGGWQGGAWVFDFARHAMIRVSEPDDWAEVPLRSDSLPPGSVQGGMNMLAPAVRTASLGREIIVPRSGGTMQDGLLQYRLSLLGADLISVDPETGGVRTLISLGDELDDPSGDFIPSEGGFPLWYRLWAACGEDLVRVYDRVRNQLLGFDGSGAEVEPVDLPPVPFTEVSARQFARAVFGLRQAEVTGAVGVRLTAEDSARVLDQLAGMVEGRPHELASYLPRYVDMRCSDDGTLWMQPLDVELGGLRGGRLWLRIAPDGGVREVRLPERFDAFRFLPSRVWGVYRDENDIASVASDRFAARLRGGDENRGRTRGFPDIGVAPGRHSRDGVATCRHPGCNIPSPRRSAVPLSPASNPPVGRPPQHLPRLRGRPLRRGLLSHGDPLGELGAATPGR